MKPYQRSKEKGTSQSKIHNATKESFDYSEYTLEEMHKDYELSKNNLSDNERLNCDIKFRGGCKCKNSCCLREETWDSEEVGAILFHIETQAAAYLFTN